MMLQHNHGSSPLQDPREFTEVLLDLIKNSFLPLLSKPRKSLVLNPRVVEFTGFIEQLCNKLKNELSKSEQDSKKIEDIKEFSKETQNLVASMFSFIDCPAINTSQKTMEKIALLERVNLFQSKFLTTYLAKNSTTREMVLQIVAAVLAVVFGMALGLVIGAAVGGGFGAIPGAGVGAYAAYAWLIGLGAGGVVGVVSGYAALRFFHNPIPSLVNNIVKTSQDIAAELQEEQAVDDDVSQQVPNFIP